MKKAKKAPGATAAQGTPDVTETVSQQEDAAQHLEQDATAAVVGPERDAQPADPTPPAGAAQPVVAAAEPSLSLHLSAALAHKLRQTAREEGVSLEALAQELLAEGVTLRAWEIIERKSAMRGAATGGPLPGHQGGGNNRNGNFNRRYNGGNGNGNGNGGGPSGGNRGNQNRRPNNAWMEDKAAFLEYVRNQEKRRR